MNKRLQILSVGALLLGALLAAWWTHSPLYREVRAVASFTTINAPADKVLGVLEDFQRYPEWNPYILSAVPKDKNATGAPAKLRIVEHSSGGRHTHTVELTHWDATGFQWSGSTTPAWVLSWSESFTVTPMDASHCRLEVAQSYQGLLLRFYWNYYNHKTLEVVKQMGQALKKRVE